MRPPIYSLDVVIGLTSSGGTVELHAEDLTVEALAEILQLLGAVGQGWREGRPVELRT